MINKMLVIQCNLNEHPYNGDRGERYLYTVIARTDQPIRTAGKVVVTYDSTKPVEVGTWVMVDILPAPIMRTEDLA